ncbi:MAG: hypothetical protein ABI041_08320, partial [Bdellovibrionia bacterium]
MAYNNLFVRVLILALTVEVSTEKLGYALCDSKGAPKDVESLCQVINSVELGTDCVEFKNDQDVYDACISLHDLSTGGDCGNLKGKESVTSYLICNEIYSGLNADNCESEGGTSPGGLSPQESQ